MLDYGLMIVAAFAAGVLNAIAGGGTFLTFPALVYLGLPPVSANATATLVALPGYLSSAWAFRRDLRPEGSLPLRAIIAVAAAGAVVGAVLLLVTPGKVFSGVVPWLLLLATLLFALGPHLLAAARARGMGVAGPVPAALGIFVVSVYGGYFNGGLGIMLLATFSLLGYVDLHGMNGLKNMLSAILSLISAATFIVAGLIAWKPALIMAAAATAGGYIGASQSRKITRTGLLRAFVIVVGAVMTLLFFLK